MPTAQYPYSNTAMVRSGVLPYFLDRRPPRPLPPPSSSRRRHRCAVVWGFRNQLNKGAKLWKSIALHKAQSPATHSTAHTTAAASSAVAAAAATAAAGTAAAAAAASPASIVFFALAAVLLKRGGREGRRRRRRRKARAKARSVRVKHGTLPCAVSAPTLLRCAPVVRRPLPPPSWSSQACAAAAGTLTPPRPASPFLHETHWSLATGCQRPR